MTTKELFEKYFIYEDDELEKLIQMAEGDDYDFELLKIIIKERSIYKSLDLITELEFNRPFFPMKGLMNKYSTKIINPKYYI